MKITLDNAILAGGGAEGPANFRLSTAWSVQFVELVRARFADQIARENIRHEINFNVTRLHASVQAAMKFILEHAESLPASGVLSFLTTGAGASRRWIKGATLLRADCVQQIGMTTIWAYQLAGGQILTTDPRLTTGVTA